MTEHQAPSGDADVAMVARAEAEAMAPILAARKVRLVQEIAPRALAAPADADQVAQVVRNLLDNAVRHGREGGEVRLSVAPAPGRDGRPGVALSVADDGPGIPREHIPRLTERFYRVDKGRSRSAGGTGLGLAIVRHIVNRHRGTLTIESEEGVGTTFRVWLPGR
jgi:two-component system phosphate regulon sensor histidine kinase PhoR